MLQRPDENFPVALCVIVEHGHHGGSVAAPLAGELIEYIYEEQEYSAKLARFDGDTR